MPIGRPILTAARMREAEERVIAAGTPAEALMERAGAALAEALLRFSGGKPVLSVCGTGNNGGDGYVAARHLANRGVQVRVAAIGEPKADAARWARSQWVGPVEPLGVRTAPAPALVDCLFGTGLKSGLEEPVLSTFLRLHGSARVSVACDLPSGVQADSGALLSDVPRFDLTVTFGALKPAHRLSPAMRRCGRVVLADIGIAAESDWEEIGPPILPALSPDGHKFDRGLVHALAGAMPGAIALAASAAARAGAGYVRVSTSKTIDHLPASVVQTDTATLNDPRIGCLLVGPGMGSIPQLLTLALTSHAPKVIDADAIGQVGEPERLKGQDAILTPHAGEFAKLFGFLPGSKADQAVAAAGRSGAIVVYKGSDTIVAAPDGRIAFAPPTPAWLASAGTGDVLAGIIAAMRARGMAAFEAACAGVWIHGRAAEAAGASMIADDLLVALPTVLSEL
ncbi:NAD(P)H-hydrate dehydratase [Sphingomonas piscis]|uniref:Bifunctional NAD(P)H-hydrate repair enzyme n=1 Tax=Sphingomonas piscis TaxID=2714943 RepID=A0A6G7YLJ0_9SPHN|nr:NAD(P)H-hydrate dehydratase [Sphingomonas piscis]QIK77610.1 NAD(P)H-hydrate dehydratase [Sphingomonas piscis]